MYTVTRQWGESNRKETCVAANTIEQAIQDMRRYMKKNYLSGEIIQAVELCHADVAYKH